VLLWDNVNVKLEDWARWKRVSRVGVGMVGSLLVVGRDGNIKSNTQTCRPANSFILICAHFSAA